MGAGRSDKHRHAQAVGEGVELLDDGPGNGNALPAAALEGAAPALAGHEDLGDVGSAGQRLQRGGQPGELAPELGQIAEGRDIDRQDERILPVVAAALKKKFAG